jgi:hypothetical protein
MNEDASQDFLQEEAAPFRADALPLAEYVDPVIEVFKKDVDRTMLRENLKLTPNERSRKFERAMKMVFELRRSANSSR